MLAVVFCVNFVRAGYALQAETDDRADKSDAALQTYMADESCDRCASSGQAARRRARSSVKGAPAADDG